MAPRFPGSDTTYLGQGDTYGPLPDHGYTNLKVVYHTTETRGMPGFGDGITAPHYVYSPLNKKWFVWTDVDRRVGTMKGHATNHANDDSIQVEILGYSNRNHTPWVGDFDDEDYNELARFFRWTMDECSVGSGVTVQPPQGWLYGSGSPFRLTEAEWHAFSGLTAHGAAPGNSHRDTGILDLGRIHDIAMGDDMNYRDVENVPNQQWARDVIDWGIENKIIITGDNNQDDWDKNVNYGQLWSLLERMDRTFH